MQLTINTYMNCPTVWDLGCWWGEGGGEWADLQESLHSKKNDIYSEANDLLNNYTPESNEVYHQRYNAVTRKRATMQYPTLLPENGS